MRLTGRMICADMHDVSIIREHLPEHIRLTNAETGCLSFKVWQAEDPLIWNVEEAFTDPAAFAHHQQRTRASNWWRATARIPRRYDISGPASE